MRKIVRTTVFICTILSLTACGFHLRQPAKLPPELQILYVAPYSSNPQLIRKIRRALHVAGVHISHHEKRTTLRILRATQETTPVGYGSDGQVHRERHTLTLQFQLFDKKKRAISPVESVYVRRDQTVNPNDTLSRDQESAILVTEMQQDAIDEIVRKLSTLSPKQSHAPQS